MGRPKKAAAPKHVEPEDQSQEELEATPPESVSKVEAVRRAVAAGVETPAQGADYVMKHFGIEMDNKTFSLNRSQAKSRAAKLGGATKGKPGRKPKVVAERGGSIVDNGFVAQPAKPRANGEGDLLETLEALKPLIASQGAARLKRLVDLIS